MRAYVVMVAPEAHEARISQEGYSSLEKAQAFIEGRSPKPEKVSDYLYHDADYTYYMIWNVRIV